MAQFHLDPTHRFVITGYGEMRPFASFLPGIAGPLGIPMWAFYVNRGQALAGFGVESKDAPLMEFQPANKAYQDVSLNGFRTFIKIDFGSRNVAYEPFSPRNTIRAECQQMLIGLNELELQETNPDLDLQTRVRYFILPNEPLAGLVRHLAVHNTGHETISMSVIDGLPRVIPYGVNNFLLKELGRTVEAWMEVFNVPANAPFYRLRASVIDRAEVETYQAGHFAAACEEGGAPLPVVVDPVLVFGQDTAFYQPGGFYRQPLEKLLEQNQITCGRTPCCFFAHQAVVSPGEWINIDSVFGHINSLELLTEHLPRIIQPAYLQRKHEEAVALAVSLTDVVATQSSSPLFDAYCRQNFLDNILRGGWPVKVGEQIVPIYSRKHGDLERDYNAFYLAAEPYSQGEGSYRDINQNCRSNVLVKPEIGDYDIQTFMSLIQADGYNPRAVKGSTFSLTPERQKSVLSYARQPEKIADMLAKPFTPGKLLRTVYERQVVLALSPEEFLHLALSGADRHLEADFHEGYWIDHWEYNLDLIESFLAVYPDQQEDLLYRTCLPFFDSPVFVQPRSRRYVLVNGAPRQLNSLIEDHEKAARHASRPAHQQWLRRQDTGEIYRTSLFGKLFGVVLLKFSTLDPWGLGIEMEAGRPGWDDALNGLPGLFGSGMAETYELARWTRFLLNAIAVHADGGIRIPQELAFLLGEISAALEAQPSSTPAERSFTFWDTVSSAKETYRQRTRLGFSGDEIRLPADSIQKILAAIQEKLLAGIELAVEMNQGLPPTYITYVVDEYDVLSECDPQGHPYIRPRRFTPTFLPLFLEGPTRAYKILPDVNSARALYQDIKASPLFDPKLGMYKLNASLENQPHDIGRARAFPPGWLENESIWLHMAYKYLLEMLKAGLYEQFFADMKDILVPFMDPQIYGRSPLENASFLVSSAHPDKNLHGAGFVARLSGSTAEFISIWHVMMAGKQPFTLRDGRLCLALRPALPGWLFAEDGTLSFCFLGSCTVQYHNAARDHILAAGPNRILFSAPDGPRVEITGPDLISPYAEMVRNGKITALDVWF